VTETHLHFEVLPLNPDFNNGYAGRIDPAPFLG
jgi:murein DD-endopeptidase MepM/ murein hydrolase activator NlpD